jgi:hypothetical protein
MSKSSQEPKQGSIPRRHGSAEGAGRNVASAAKCTALCERAVLRGNFSYISM